MTDNYSPAPPGMPPSPVEEQKKPFYKKKKFIGAGAIVAVIALIGAGGGGGAEAPSAATSDDVERLADADNSAAEPESNSDSESDEAQPVDETEETPKEELATSSRNEPFGLDNPVAVRWDVFGDADDSIWNTTIGAPTDITAEVLAENSFNEDPEEGFVFAGFPIELELVSANKQPLSTGFNLSFEIVGGATAGAYDSGCGVTPGEFDDFQEAFEGGVLKGIVCRTIPAEDLDHPATTVALKFGSDTREYFGSAGSPGASMEVVPTPFDQLNQDEGGRANPYAMNEATEVRWDVLGDADESVWSTTIGPLSNITPAVLAENQFNDSPADGMTYAGFDVTMELVSANKEPLSVGFNVTIEVVGGATNLAYSEDCGVVAGEFDQFAEVFGGGNLSGTLCIEIPASDLEHPDTRVALKFDSDTRAYFG